MANVVCESVLNYFGSKNFLQCLHAEILVVVVTLNNFSF